ncbi:MAG: (S)-ureidoglycine aminohydrolase [Rhodobacteraceae bacterium]|uniref:bifunctional allantoicase/(S)-ureidoglycine aminohydrolase n=1 Tax=Amaricoccus sp. B4 TaxID=3368557 RepID=UPI000DADD103|nr:(S)-ureidoglycine aminohydrolase [Paracoccaceae bacterium]
MSKHKYYPSMGGLPPQSQLLSGRAVFTETHAVIPKGVLSSITASRLPHWENTLAWVLARPMSGFAETFAQYLMEVSPGGGSDQPEPDPGAEAVLFLMEGELDLTIRGEKHHIVPGGYVFLPPGCPWSLRVAGQGTARFHWIRKRYEAAEGIDLPDVILANDNDIAPEVMPDTEGRWSTTRFVHWSDMRHDMHVTIVNMEPGAVIPFLETHVMEHGLYVLQGRGVYRLNDEWVEVEAGDFMWLRAFCPQACYAGGPSTFRYLLYKDMNRHAPLALRAPALGGAALPRAAE